jgi:hypothetical protein
MYKDKDVQKEYQKQYYINNKINILNKTRKNTLKRCYDITIEQYNQMFNVQEGKCAICGRHQNELKQPLHVDHNHITGEVRGLLCYNCNPMLGYAKSNVNILKKAIEYLEEL